MLGGFLRSLWRALRRDGGPEADEFPVARQQVAKRAHAQAPIGEHSRILFDDMRIGDWRLPELVARSLADSNATVPPLKALHRPLASYLLARYYLHALRLPGARAECGVFQGSSAVLLCHAARTVDAAHDGAGLHLIDSFEGLSEPGEQDRFSVPGAGGAPTQRPVLPRGSFSAAYGQAREALRAFPGVAFHKGWIPQVFGGLPEQAWSFVHIDVDLYEPTYACLEYFHPRLVRGGVIICDDYGAPLFPGAARAWNRYCDGAGLPFVVLDTGQAVILKA
jgi:hypothetical protein